MNYLIVDDDSCFAELLQKKILCSAQYDKQTDRIHAETKLGEVTDKSCFGRTRFLQILSLTTGTA